MIDRITALVLMLVLIVQRQTLHSSQRTEPPPLISNGHGHGHVGGGSGFLDLPRVSQFSVGLVHRIVHEIGRTEVPTELTAAISAFRRVMDRAASAAPPPTSAALCSAAGDMSTSPPPLASERPPAPPPPPRLLFARFAAEPSPCAPSFSSAPPPAPAMLAVGASAAAADGALRLDISAHYTAHHRSTQHTAHSTSAHRSNGCNRR
jgi:hypothetical protein